MSKFAVYFHITDDEELYQDDDHFGYPVTEECIEIEAETIIEATEKFKEDTYGFRTKIGSVWPILG